MFEYIACTHKGKGRKHNEDRVMIDNYMLVDGIVSGESEDSLVAVVCDGVGGTKGGAAAAEISAAVFADMYQPGVSALMVSRNLNKANRIIMKRQKDNDKLTGMATTTAGIILYNKQYYIFSVGDTRVYEIANHQLIKHTDDCIYKNVNSPFFGRLTYYIGGDGRSCFPTVKRGSVIGEKSSFLICSDGLYKYISDESIKNICDSEFKIEEKSKAIMQLALHNGSTDDMSLILIG